MPRPARTKGLGSAKPKGYRFYWGGLRVKIEHFGLTSGQSLSRKSAKCVFFSPGGIAFKGKSTLPFSSLFAQVTYLKKRSFIVILDIHLDNTGIAHGFVNVCSISNVHVGFGQA